MIKQYRKSLVPNNPELLVDEGEPVSVRLAVGDANNFICVGSSDVTLENGFTLKNSGDKFKVFTFIVIPGDKFCAISSTPIDVNVLVMSLS